MYIIQQIWILADAAYYRRRPIEQLDYRKVAAIFEVKQLDCFLKADREPLEKGPL